MVPYDVSVPRAKGVFVSPDGGVAQLGATVTATVTAVTTLASPTLSSAPLTARFMLPPDLGRLAISDVGDEQLLMATSLSYRQLEQRTPTRSGPEARALASLRGYVAKHPDNPGALPHQRSAAQSERAWIGLGLAAWNGGTGVEW